MEERREFDKMRLETNQDIKCTDCLYRKEDVHIGTSVMSGATFISCKKYDFKPKAVLDGKNCKEYKKDDES